MPLIATRTKAYALAIFTVLLITIIIDQIWFSNSDVANTIDDAKFSTPKLLVNETTAVASADLPTVASLAVTNIELPLPPVGARTNEAEQSQVDKVFANEKRVKRAQKEIFTKHTDTMKNMIDSHHLPLVTNRTLSPNIAQINSRIDQLVNLSNNKRTLYFPRIAQERNGTKRAVNKQDVMAVINYMHQCVNIDIGALDQGQLILFSHKNKQHSKIMRLASGYFTAYEIGLLNSYAPNKPLVRLYPSWFDRQLSIHIQQNLDNMPLTQISGEYKLIGKRLYLDDISINDTRVSGKWLLKQGC